MQNPELAHPHDLLVRRFLTDPELMADLLRYYPQNPAEQRMIALLDLERLVCKDPVTVNERLAEIRGDLQFSTSFKNSDHEANVYLLFEHQSTKGPKFRFRGLNRIVPIVRRFASACFPPACNSFWYMLLPAVAHSIATKRSDESRTLKSSTGFSRDKINDGITAF